MGLCALEEPAWTNPLSITRKMLMVNHIDSAAAGHVDQLGHILVQMKGISLIRQVVIQVNPADIR